MKQFVIIALMILLGFFGLFCFAVWRIFPEKPLMSQDKSETTYIVLSDQNIERLKMQAFFSKQHGDSLAYQVLTTVANQGFYVVENSK